MFVWRGPVENELDHFGRFAMSSWPLRLDAATPIDSSWSDYNELHRKLAKFAAPRCGQADGGQRVGRVWISIEAA